MMNSKTTFEYLKNWIEGSEKVNASGRLRERRYAHFIDAVVMRDEDNKWYDGDDDEKVFDMIFDEYERIQNIVENLYEDDDTADDVKKMIQRDDMHWFDHLRVNNDDVVLNLVDEICQKKNKYIEYTPSHVKYMIEFAKPLMTK